MALRKPAENPCLLKSFLYLTKGIIVDHDWISTASPGGLHLIRGMDAAAAYISENFFPCTVRYVKEITGTKSGDLAYFKIAGRRHYDPADIARWVASRRLAPQQERSA